MHDTRDLTQGTQELPAGLRSWDAHQQQCAPTGWTRHSGHYVFGAYSPITPLFQGENRYHTKLPLLSVVSWLRHTAEHPGQTLSRASSRCIIDVRV